MTESNGHSTEAQQARELGREQRELDCTLGDVELRARGDEMASAELEIDKLKEQRKGLNGQIADLRATCGKLAEAIDERSETRMVACVWIEELPQNAKRLVRQDTGETIDTRSLEVDELQDTLPGVDTSARAANDNDSGEGELVTDDLTGEVLAVDLDAGPGDEDDSDEDDSDDDDDDEASYHEVAAAELQVQALPSPARNGARLVTPRAAKRKPAAAAKKKGKPAKSSKHTRHIHA